ncbi:hypothetical protein LWI29_034505 [Acer saccharum]|uniref:Amino acid transporter transmembrane domain-containing protein n=1 Tax=Acer saccharum TaxID=4024 RepID=A0AA39SL70_ACESA|nr:hypothetical protein LWI29_034505 [Acer saccharum]
MGTVQVSSSMAMDISTADKERGLIDSPEELDAGALFVLQSRGSWVHCGYHLTTSIVGPVIFSLPFALALLGWVPGVVCVAMAALVTFYAYNLLSAVLEHHAQQGKRLLRFRDMATHILGPGWGTFFVGPLQFAICYGAVIACTLLGGQSLKFIYLLYQPKGRMQLYQFIIIFSTVPLILAQTPSFHSLRHINLVSLLLCLVYSICVTAGSIYIGKSKDAPFRDYSMNGSQLNKVFGAFNGISIISTTFASGIIPEIQATIVAPVKGKMFKGLCMCYGVIISTFFSVAISGYWAFGNQSKGTILYNFMGDEKPLLPTWFLLMTNIFTLMQLIAVTLIYLQPTNELFEKWFANPKMDQFSTRNILPRLIFRSLSVITATTLATMLPFFGDIMALFGAFGCIPLDFILPMVFYNVTFKPTKQSIVFWGKHIDSISVLRVGGSWCSGFGVVMVVAGFGDGDGWICGSSGRRRRGSGEVAGGFVGAATTRRGFI